MNISICICTKNRKKSLKMCVDSILANTNLPNEVMIVNQGDKKIKKSLFKKTNINIRIFNQSVSNLSKGRNLAILKAKSNILIFTDDDCIVAKDWIKEVSVVFKKNPECVGVFGQVLPYKKNDHNLEICPSTITKTSEYIISDPIYHAQSIGFGNNMAYRKSIFQRLGGFKMWLGPGSIGMNADDAEMTTRLLFYGIKILYEPKIIVYHDRWIRMKEYPKTMRRYFVGDVICYAYYALKNSSFAKGVIKDYLRGIKQKIGGHINKKLNVYLEPGNAFSSIGDIICVLYGLFIAFIFFIFESFLDLRKIFP